MDEDLEPLVLSSQQSSTSSNRLLERCHTYPRVVSNLKIEVIFVAAFDTLKGNVIEWCYPDYMQESLTKSGVEFKSLPSGAHTQLNDFVYIRDEVMYGVACFERLPVTYEGERGARMKSVGILCYTDDYLHIHQQQLKPLLSNLLNNQGDYEQLYSYYKTWQSNIQENATSLPLQISCADNWFDNFITKYGVSLFIIWKAMLLSKRVLFYNTPPASDLSKIVYCSGFMMKMSMSSRTVTHCKNLYFINITDIPTLNSELSYIACTTEKIFETKRSLYDVYVDCNKVNITNTRLRKVLQVTSGDRHKFKLLVQKIRQPLPDSSEMTVEEKFYSYFYELNSNFMTCIERYVNQDKPSISRENMSEMNFHHSDDTFLQEFVETLDYDLTVDSCLSCQCLPS